MFKRQTLFVLGAGSSAEIELPLGTELAATIGKKWTSASTLISKLLAELHIIHPYGLVGDVPFGAKRADYVALASGIKTYTEQIGSLELIKQVQAEVERAECIVFLGFAYHSQNMAILKPSKAMSPKYVYGTAYKMSDADVDVVSNQIANFFAPTMSVGQRSERIRLENKLKSADLFDNYARSLSGGD
jgi:hypothetical protein